MNMIYLYIKDQYGNSKYIENPPFIPRKDDIIIWIENHEARVSKITYKFDADVAYINCNIISELSY